MTQPFPPYEPYQPHPTPNSPSQDQPTYVDLATPVDMPPPPRRPIGMWRTLWVVGVAVLACAVAATIGAAAALGGVGQGGGKVATTTPTRTTTTTGVASASVANATLGGTLAGFEAQYGRPTTITNQGVYFWNAVTVNGHQLTLQFTLATGQDGALYVNSVTIHVIGGANTSWDTPTAFALAQRFAPVDATAISEQTSSSNYLIHFDSSSALGATFGVVSSSSDEGVGSRSGQFVISCHLIQPGAQHVDRCTLALSAQHVDD